MSGTKAVDRSNYYQQSYFPTVFFRGDRVKDLVSRRKWAWLTVVELIVGVDLIESILATSSVPPHKNIRKKDSNEYGLPQTLNNHIPAGMITNLLRPNVIEVLYFKYYGQYLILWPDSEIRHDEAKTEIDLTRYRFAAGKDRLNQLMALRKVYDGSWLIANLSIDALVWIASQNLESVLISALLVEGLRRALRI